MAFVQESRFKDRNYSTDFGGVVLITMSLSALIFGLIEGQTYGWLVPNDTFAIENFAWPFTNISITAVSIAAGILLFVLFTLLELRRMRGGEVPLVDFSLLRYKGFRYGVLTVTIVAMGEFGIFFILSLYLQIVRGLSAIDTGITLLPMALVVLISAPLAGLVSSRVGPKWIVISIPRWLSTERESVWR
jgi:predicted MFS family arabinose efflux permease